MTQHPKPDRSSIPNCPQCRRKLFVSPTPDGRQWFCSDCKGLFETDNEGGDYSDHNPAARLEREERRVEREREERARRRGRNR